jgi:hypothetical protein
MVQYLPAQATAYVIGAYSRVLLYSYDFIMNFIPWIELVYLYGISAMANRQFAENSK